MSIGSQIAFYRKKLNITQEALAQKLAVSNQAVSKWESEQCCPDISLLPLLADLFNCTIDQLFERKPEAPFPISGLPWNNDNTLRVVVYHGHTLVVDHKACKEMTFQYEGPALNVDCALNLSCQEVAGNAHASGSITCNSVGGSVNAGGSVTADSVGGNIHSGGSVTCDSVGGDVNAGGSVNCDSIEGNADAGGNITCEEICGNAAAKGTIFCDEINMESGKESNVHIHREGSFKFTFHKE